MKTAYIKPANLVMIIGYLLDNRVPNKSRLSGQAFEHNSVFDRFLEPWFFMASSALVADQHAPIFTWTLAVDNARGRILVSDGVCVMRMSLSSPV